MTDDEREHLLAEEPEPASEEEPVRPDVVDGLVPEEAHEQRPQDAADEVHSDDVQRIVVPEDGLEPQGDVAHEAGQGANQDCRGRVDVACRRRDRREARNGTGHPT